MCVLAPVPDDEGDSMAPDVREDIESRIDVGEVHEDEDSVDGLGGKSWSSG